MTRKLPLPQAVSIALTKQHTPVATSYELGLLTFGLYREKKIEGQELSVRSDIPNRRQYRAVVDALRSYGILRPVPGIAMEQAFLLGPGDIPSIDVVLCSVDPFAYISHFTAMAFHGFTERIPQLTYITTPPPRLWRQYADKKMKDDLADSLQDYLDSGLPTLQRARMQTVLGQRVHTLHRKHWGGYRNVRDTGVRVSSIGRTFLDMSREPDLCGGMRHVMEVFRENAQRNLRLIVAEVEQHGGPIDKVRVGYMLSEECGVSDPVVAAWKQFAQRGGSRKLYAQGEYSSQYSEDWCLSLNVEG